MTAWLSAAPVFILGSLLIIIPGLPVAWLLKFRGLGLYAMSIGTSFALIAVSSILSSIVGVNWSLIPLFAVTLLITGLVFGVSRFFPPREAHTSSAPQRKNQLLHAFIGLSFAALMILWVLTRSLGAPDALSQNYDTPFHLNLVAHMLQTGVSSPFETTLTSHEGIATFYPAVWHSFTALLVQISGAEVLVASNIANLLIASLVWPASMLFLVHTLFAKQPKILLFAGVLLPLFASFPYRFFAWGLLYPNLLSTALLPLSIALALSLVLSRHIDAREVPNVSLWISAVAMLCTVVLCHPNALFSAAAILLAPVLVASVSGTRHYTTSKKVLHYALGTLFLVAIVLMWIVVSTGDNSRTYEASFLHALKEGLVTSPLVYTDMWLLGAVVIAGAVLLIKSKKHRWLVVSYAISLVLFAISMGPDSPLRSTVTQAWYNDSHRLAAILPITAIPLAAVAMSSLYSFITRQQNVDGVDVQQQKLHTGTTVAISAAVILLFVGHLVPELRANISPNFTLDEQSEFVTPDELELIERIPQFTPDEALIASDPWNGSVYIFALTERELLFPHLKGSFNENARLLASNFNEDSPEMCALINDLGVTHFVGSGHPLYREGRDPFIGLQDIEDSPFLTEIDRVGDAALYAVTGCN